MSAWSIVAIIIAAPIAILVAVLGLTHLGLAIVWVSRLEERPSAIPLFGLILPLLLLLLAAAMEPRWARLSAASVAAAGLSGELALLAAKAIISVRRRAGRP